MNSIQINPSWLKAAAVCSAVKDIRYYLNGVLVDVRARETRIVSTDGHRLVCLRREVPENEPDQVPAQIIIPGDVIKAAKARKDGNDCILQYGEVTAEGNMVDLKCQLTGLASPDMAFLAIDGKFPDYERVMPRTAPTMEFSHFNMEYLADMTRVIRIASGSAMAHAEIWPSGNSSGAVTCSAMPEFYGVVMPMRGSAEFTLPAWLGEVQQPVQLRKVA